MPSSTVILISQDPGLIKNTKQWAKDQSITIQVFSYTEWENYVHQPVAIQENFQSHHESPYQLKMSTSSKSYNFYEKKDQTSPVLPTSATHSQNSEDSTNSQKFCEADPHSPSTSLNTPSPKKRIQTMNELENQAIQEAIFEFNGNLTEAAKALGIGRATLYRKVKQYNIDLVATRKKMAS